MHDVCKRHWRGHDPQGSCQIGEEALYVSIHAAVYWRGNSRSLSLRGILSEPLLSQLDWVHISLQLVDFSLAYDASQFWVILQSTRILLAHVWHAQRARSMTLQGF